MDAPLIEGPGNHPGPALIDLPPNRAVTDPCGCNSPRTVHQRGDAAFCRATLAVLGAR